ncbi:M81 family metallopeptidase [Ochrobactrum intermedium]|nr:M81 family metallopeptidase [Brucella intermedia]
MATASSFEVDRWFVYAVPIAITLDLHANIFDELADLAQIAVSFRTYPHIDMVRSGRGLFVAGSSHEREIEPALAIGRPPMLRGLVMMVAQQITVPMCRLLESAPVRRCNNRNP